MTAKLYIGNIDYSVCGQDLSVLFSEVGTVLAIRIVSDRVTGQSRGFGFVEMSNPHEAEKAISQFNGYTLLGRKMLVHLAHDNKELSQRIREAKQNHQKELAAGSITNVSNQNNFSQYANKPTAMRMAMTKRAS
jgi:RNA recognition motif-containing protein